MHICHVTSVHPRYDSRIFHKMCKSAVKRGLKTTLIVADGLGDELVEGVQIIDVGVTNSRLKRMFLTQNKIFFKALKIKADLYQIHDPELLPAGLLLKQFKKIIIFDSHEDTANTILISPYLNPFFAKITSNIYKSLEYLVCKRIDGVIGATPHIEKIFASFSKKIININNFPIIDLNSEKVDFKNKKNEICYTGSIGISRGIKEIFSSLELISSNTRLNLAGQYSNIKLEDELKRMSVYNKVNDFGFVNKNQVKEIYARSVSGIIISHPMPTYLVSLPIKMFEFMAAGIPFIISDFPYWRELLKGYNCCIFVNPLNSKEIANAIDYLINNKEIASEMGSIGNTLVIEKFNWKNEEEKLISFYENFK